VRRLLRQGKRVFQNAGLNVEVELNPRPGVASAVVAGTYDIAFAGISTLASAHAKGLPFRPHRALRHHRSRYVPADNGRAAIADPYCQGLQWQDVRPSGLNTQSEYGPRAWIDKHGGDSTTCKFIEMPFPRSPTRSRPAESMPAILVEPFSRWRPKRDVVRMIASGDDAVVRPSRERLVCTRLVGEGASDAVTAFATAIVRAAVGQREPG